eukprot:RCo011525
MVTVQEIRAALTPEQNRAYKDYQIQWWIEHKKNKKEDVLRTIGNQAVTEQRVMDIFHDPQRRERVFHELNLRVLNPIYMKDLHQMMVFVNTKNKPKTFNEEQQADAMLLFLYYLQHQLETIEGDGATAVMLVDMINGPPLTYNEIRANIRMFSGIIGRSFPKIYKQVISCSELSAVFRKAISALARAGGINSEFLTAKEVVARFGTHNVPAPIGGTLQLEELRPMGEVVRAFFLAGANNRTFSKAQLATIHAALSGGAAPVAAPAAPSPAPSSAPSPTPTPPPPTPPPAAVAPAAAVPVPKPPPRPHGSHRRVAHPHPTGGVAAAAAAAAASATVAT